MLRQKEALATLDRHAPVGNLYRGHTGANMMVLHLQASFYSGKISNMLEPPGLRLLVPWSIKSRWHMAPNWGQDVLFCFAID